MKLEMDRQKNAELSKREQERGVRICRKSPYLINAQKEYHKLCMAVNRKFGGIWGWTCGTTGFKEDEFKEYYNRIGLDIETGLPIEGEKEKPRA